jgi:hypothetical protein
LGDIEKEVVRMGKSPQKDQYLEIVTDFKIFKDAWRNDVSHAGNQYDETDATSIYNHVKRYMKSMVKYGFKE